MLRFLRPAALALLAAAAVLALILLAFVALSEASRPVRSGLADLPGLGAPVRILYDERGVPHIFADSEPDAYRALGYVQTKDRWWQMELARRVARGELSEILGAPTLEADVLFRTLGLSRFGQQYLQRRGASLDPAMLRNLQAYVDGINAHVERGPLPLEFRLLQAPRRNFELSDIFAISGYVAYTFLDAMETDPTATYIRDALGPQYLQGVAWDGAQAMAAIRASAKRETWGGDLQPAAWLRRDLQPAIQRMQSIAALAPAARSLAGSNAWIVSGARSDSGYPILCNDPHIAFSQPGAWYEAHLHTPQLNLYGHYLAALPLPLVGHTDDHAWGLTMLLNDDADFYVETPAPGVENAILYRGQVAAMELQREDIQIRGAGIQSIVVRSSVHGPIINDVFDGFRSQRRPVALRWGYLNFDNDIAGAFHSLAHATSLADARQAASRILSPGLNVLYANRQGDIGWWAAGRQARLQSSASRAFLLDGASGRYDLRDFLPFADNPHQENPPDGLIVSANNRMLWGQGHPLEGYYSPDARALRIRQLLEAQPKLGVADMKRIQLDRRDNRLALAVRDAARLALHGDLDSTPAASLLQQYWQWDGAYEADLAAPMLHWEFSYQLLRAAMVDELGEDFFAVFLRSPASIWTLLELLQNDSAPWWDDRSTPEPRESRATIVRRAMLRAIVVLQERYGANFNDWQWQTMHAVVHQHALGGLWPLGLLLNVGPYPAPGGRETINNYHFPFESGAAQVSIGPSTRRIIDLAAPQRALGILPAGQSGHWLDANYQDQALDHLQGRWRTQWMDPAELTAHQVNELILRPTL
ncbi:MAG: penicillin acylase family protein [Leptospirales bacterium]|nr:penicillin acylase family protein [Leptospirales bacterium]